MREQKPLLFLTRSLDFCSAAGPKIFLLKCGGAREGGFGSGRKMRAGFMIGGILCTYVFAGGRDAVNLFRMARHAMNLCLLGSFGDQIPSLVRPKALSELLSELMPSGL